MVHSVNFSLFVIRRDWNVESIEFPLDEISIYNIDKVSDLLKKVQLILNVNPKRFHVRGLTIPFDKWLKINKITEGKEVIEENVNVINQLNESNTVSSSNINLGFSNSSNDNIYPTLVYKKNIINTDIPLHAFYQQGISIIADVPCDNQYVLFKKLVIDTTDKFLSDFAPLNQAVVILLDDFVEEQSQSSRHILQDSFIFERVFEGFIKKYFPLMNIIDFQSYLSGNIDNSIEKVSNIIEQEYKIFDILNKFSSKKSIDSIKLNKFISSATLSVDKSITQSNLNLRNLFDKLHISPLSQTKDLQIYMLYYELPIEKTVKKYILHKLRSNSQQFKILAKFREGLTIVRIVDKQIEYINITEDGNWSITTSWKEENSMIVEDIIKYCIKSSLNVITHINTLIPFFAKESITTMTNSNNKITNITVSLLWTKTLNYIEFRTLRQQFNEFIMGEMAESRTSPILEVMWFKGVINPCVIKIFHRVTDVKIDIIETSPKDYENITGILIPFFAFINEKINNLPKTKESNDQKLIRKLREQDSQLYDKLKEGNIYSKKCQGIRQPIILTDEEYSKLKPNQKEEVYKYWNFTRNSPAYYSCQLDKSTGKHLIMSFLTGIHEDNYCVPCCKKKELNESSKHHERDKECLDNHTYSKVNKSTYSGYIFVSNKTITEGRLGYLPNTIIDLLESKNDEFKQLVEIESSDEEDEDMMESSDNLFDENYDDIYDDEEYGDELVDDEYINEYNYSRSHNDVSGGKIKVNRKKHKHKYVRVNIGGSVMKLPVIGSNDSDNVDKNESSDIFKSLIDETNIREQERLKQKQIEEDLFVEKQQTNKQDKIDCSIVPMLSIMTGGYKVKKETPELKDREVNLHNGVSATYADTNVSHFYAYGTTQYFKAVDNAGIVHVLVHAMDMDISEFINGIVKYLKETETSYSSPMLIDALINIFIQNVDFYDWDADWVSIFADLVLEVYDINIIIFRPNSDSIRIRYNMSPKILIIQYDFEKSTEFYPIYRINTNKFNKSGIIEQKIFPSIEELDKLLPQSTSNDLTAVQKLKNIKINKQLINISNKCYAVIAEIDNEECYIPVVYSYLVSRIPLEYKVFKRSDYKLSLSASRKITKQLKGKVKYTIWLLSSTYKVTDIKNTLGLITNISDSIKPSLTFIGYCHDDMNVYCNDMSDSDLKQMDEELYNLPRYITDVDYDDINQAIQQNKQISDKIIDIYSDGYYNQHLYKFIKIELINLVDSGKIHFDTVRQMSVDQLVDLIPHEVDDKARTDSNIIISCTKSELKHCSGTKLKVPSNFRDYCELLYHEIHNPVVNFMDNQRSLVISILQFEKIQGEKITITIDQGVDN
jgi:hypothetical protein